MKLRGEMKDLTQQEYMELFYKYVSSGGTQMRHIEILTDIDMFVFIKPDGSKEIILVEDEISVFKIVEKCLYYEWIV